MKPLINKVGLAGLNFGEKWFQKPSVTKSEKRGAKLTSLLYKLDKKHRTRTHANLEIAFPEKSESERKDLAMRMYDHFGFIVSDFLRTSKLSDQEFKATMEVEGYDIYRRTFDEGKGVILVSAHLGNWERFGRWISLDGLPISGVARDADDDQITERVAEIRGSGGMKMLSRGNAAREILVRLKKGEMILIMPDQNDDAAFIPFFGKIAGTVLGPAVIHLKTKAPILPSCVLRTGPGQYKIIFREPLIAKEGESAEELMTRVNEEIEAMIRLAPEQYLWMHDRWKNARRKGLL